MKPKRLQNYLLLFLTGFVTLVLNVTARAQDTSSNAIDAARVSLRYDSGEITVVGFERVRKAIPNTDQLPEGVNELSGFWYELVGLDGSVRYRRIIGNPFLTTFEGPDPMDPQGPAVRQEGVRDPQTVMLLIPAPQAGDALVLYGPPIATNTNALPAQELVRLTLIPIIG